MDPAESSKLRGPSPEPKPAPDGLGVELRHVHWLLAWFLAGTLLEPYDKLGQKKSGRMT
jgi:hypothetical protein